MTCVHKIGSPQIRREKFLFFEKSQFFFGSIFNRFFSASIKKSQKCSQSNKKLIRNFLPHKKGMERSSYSDDENTKRCPHCMNDVVLDSLGAFRNHVAKCGGVSNDHSMKKRKRIKKYDSRFLFRERPTKSIRMEIGTTITYIDGVSRYYPIRSDKIDSDPFKVNGKKYDLIFADPPWPYRRKNGKGIAEDHYSTMSFEDIYNLPVQDLASDNCMLVLCIVSPLALECLKTIRKWGFVHKTKLINWVKTTKNGIPVWALGCYTRPCTEDVYYGTMEREDTETQIWCDEDDDAYMGVTGKAYQWIESHSVSQLLFAQRREFSRKPEEYFTLLENLFGDNYSKMNKIELFAREARKGWDAWGNEINKFN